MLTRCTLAALALALASFPAAGQTNLVIPQTRSHPLTAAPAGVAIERVKADIAIDGRTARTTLDIGLVNQANRQEEAVLLLPVPDGAVVSSFLFDGPASEPTANVYRADDARRIYDSIVNQVRDPALLEFAGYNLVRSSVFPVPAGGTQRIRLTYEHILGGEGSRVDYLLPRSESLQQRQPWEITATVKSKHPISMVYSPTHELAATRTNEQSFKITLATSGHVEPGPFRLSYLEQHDDVSASLFTYPDPTVGGGYFLLMAGLPADLDVKKAAIRREVTLVLDRSGSMAGEKMDQVRAAALQVIEGLADGEAFNIIDYGSTVASFAAAPVVRNDASAREARDYLATMRPGGGTNIHDALLEALRPAPAEGTLPIVLFLTDGLPTIGRTREADIRDMVGSANVHGRRIFTFGVGKDVNAPLLDRVADATRATASYVLPGEDVEVMVAKVYGQLYGPVLGEPSVFALDTGGQVDTRSIGELIPSNLPDLFEGDRLILLGQYRSEGPITFRLTGDYLGERREFQFSFDTSHATTANAFVPRLWASRRIAYLVDAIRQAGADGASTMPAPRYHELVDEILRLSTRFGILSEYTSFLATEGTDLGDWSRMQANCSTELTTKAIGTRWGAGAVNQAINFNQQKAQAVLNYDNRYVTDQLEEVAFTNVQQMCDRAFFKQGNRWVDSRLVGDEGGLEPEEIVPMGSDAHRALLERLIREGRQGLIALPGEILIDVDGKRLLINDGC